MAYDPTAFATGKPRASDAIQRDQWVRATVQAALGQLRDAARARRRSPARLRRQAGTSRTPTPTQGDTITITATGKDADGASTGDVSDDLSLTSSVASDTIDGNTVTFNHASPHTITATHVPTGTTRPSHPGLTKAAGGATDGSGGGSGGGSRGAGSRPAPGHRSRPSRRGSSARFSVWSLLGAGMVGLVARSRTVSPERSPMRSRLARRSLAALIIGAAGGLVVTTGSAYAAALPGRHRGHRRGELLGAL